MTAVQLGRYTASIPCIPSVFYNEEEAELWTDISHHRHAANHKVPSWCLHTRFKSATFKYLWRAQGNCDLVEAKQTSMLAKKKNPPHLFRISIIAKQWKLTVMESTEAAQACHV